MKKRLPFTLEISLWTLIVWFFLAMLKAAGWVFFCYGLMFAHEASHALTALIFGCKVQKITIYPFGLCAHIEKVDQLSTRQKLLLYSAGPAVHVIAYAAIELVYHTGAVSLVMKDYLMQLNTNYLMFNLLPIYPLDGYRLFSAIAQDFFSFQASSVLMQTVSFIFLALFMKSVSFHTLVFYGCVLLLLSINVHHCIQLHQEVKEHQMRNSIDRCIRNY